MSIHPTAVISNEAQIGENVEIGPYAIIEDNTVIGDGAFIDSHVKICRYTTIGKNARIYFGSVIGEEPQDHRMVPKTKAFTIIEDDVILREYVTVHRSPWENGTTRIGQGTLIMAFGHVGHDANIGKYVTCANHTAISGHVIVEDYAVLSGYIMLHQFCKIGSFAMVHPGTKFRQDIPPFVIINDDGYIYGVNVIGLRRANFDATTRNQIKNTIKLFCFKHTNSTKALEEFDKSDLKNPYTEHFADFYRNSERGVIAGEPKMVAIAQKKAEEAE